LLISAARLPNKAHQQSKTHHKAVVPPRNTGCCDLPSVRWHSFSGFPRAFRRSEQDRTKDVFLKSFSVDKMNMRPQPYAKLHVFPITT